jgi:hypothetical protein
MSDHKKVVLLTGGVQVLTILTSLPLPCSSWTVGDKMLSHPANSSQFQNMSVRRQSWSRSSVPQSTVQLPEPSVRGVDSLSE